MEGFQVTEIGEKIYCILGRGKFVVLRGGGRRKSGCD